MSASPCSAAAPAANTLYDTLLVLLQDQLTALHEQLGKQLAAELQPARAEPHLVAAGSWQAAASAYMKADLWQDAQRVARDHGGSNAQDEVQLGGLEILCDFAWVRDEAFSTAWKLQ